MEYPKFKVGTRCFTFNHAPYITDTMNGFTIQKTDFPFVCCIVDDASSDGEQKVILNYVKANFDLSEGSVYYQKETDYAYITYARHKTNSNCYFAVLLLKENHYSRYELKLQYLKEWMQGVPYEALCEGDDYWIDEQKLQKQVEFLDANIEFGMCYTQCNYYFQNRAFLDTRPWGGAHEKFSEFMLSNTVPTLTVMWRAKLESKYQRDVVPNSRDWMMGDYPRWIWFSHESRIKFLPYVTGRYRVLSSSASHSSDINTQIKFSESSYDIRCFFETFFNIPAGTYIAPDALVKRKLYLYAINHKVKEYFLLLMNNPTMLFNLKALSYLRYFLMRPKNSDEV